MSSLLEKALEKVGALAPEEQDAIASQILATLADERGLEAAVCRETWRDPAHGA